VVVCSLLLLQIQSEFPDILPIKESLIKYVFEPNAAKVSRFTDKEHLRGRQAFTCGRRQHCTLLAECVACAQHSFRWTNCTSKQSSGMLAAAEVPAQSASQCSLHRAGRSTRQAGYACQPMLLLSSSSSSSSSIVAVLWCLQKEEVLVAVKEMRGR
jgi:hypothetical protein